MRGFLLDTNVVSEMTKSRPSLQVIAFLAQPADLWLASLVVHELEFGLQLAPPGRRRERLRADISSLLARYADRILPIDRASAEWAARFRADAVRSGRPLILSIYSSQEQPRRMIWRSPPGMSGTSRAWESTW